MIKAKINYGDGGVDILPFTCEAEAREHGNTEARKYNTVVSSIGYTPMSDLTPQVKGG